MSAVSLNQAAETDPVRFLVTQIRRRLPQGGVIGMTGRGAAGKSTLAAALGHALPGLRVVEFDQFYFDRRQRRATLVELPGQGGAPPRMASVTGCHPDSFDRGRALELLECARNGRRLPRWQRLYRHGATEWRALPGEEPGRWTLVEGLAAWLGGLHSAYDLRVFVDCDPAVAHARRWRRDVARGQSMGEIGALREERERQYRTYVAPLRAEADLVVVSAP